MIYYDVPIIISTFEFDLLFNGCYYILTLNESDPLNNVAYDHIM
jgi:hypothetical protein